jgi:hypothetical protein
MIVANFQHEISCIFSSIDQGEPFERLHNDCIWWMELLLDDVL